MTLTTTAEQKSCRFRGDHAHAKLEAALCEHSMLCNTDYYLTKIQKRPKTVFGCTHLAQA